MKLNEKIWVCRRQAGLSQEALAEKIGVSRQAISKWETGEASPEISKLPLLARTFNVTADWLLDDEAGFETDEPEEEAPEEPAAERPAHPYAAAPAQTYPDWIDRLPGWIAHAVKKYGWLYGVRMAISGALFTLMGFVGKAMFGAMTSSFDGMVSGMFHATSNAGMTFYDNAGNVVDPSALGLSTSDLNALGLGGASGYSPFGGISVTASMTDPASILCNFIIVIGLALLIGGLLLAWYLKKKGQEAA